MAREVPRAAPRLASDAVRERGRWWLAVLGASAVLFAGAGLVRAPLAAAEPYAIDYERSELVVRVLRAGIASAFAHDHVVRAGKWQGSLDVNRDPIALAADFRVEVEGLVVDEPETRARHGLDGVLSDDDRASVRATMLGPDQLDAASHPEIRFRAAEIDRAGTGFRLAGELTLHGETERIALPITVSDDGGTLTARGTIRIAQSDFGIEPYRALLGAVRNQDEVEIVVTVVAAPARTR